MWLPAMFHCATLFDVGTLNASMMMYCKIPSHGFAVLGDIGLVDHVFMGLVLCCITK